jgi:hypothetical protein
LTTDQRQLGLPMRFIGRELVVAYLGKRKAWERCIYQRIHDKLSSAELGNAVWREDMAPFIRSLMAKRVVDRLSWNFSFRGRLIPVASPRTEDIEAVDNVSTVLIFNTLRTRADDAQDRANAILVENEKWATYFGTNFGKRYDPHDSANATHHSPAWYLEPLVPHLQPRIQFPELEFKTTVWRGKKVPVYSLTDLLGSEKAKELITSPRSKYEAEKCVVIKRARHNVPVEILLMQLQAYLAQPGA